MADSISSNWASANGINTAFGGNRYFYAESREATFLGVTSTPYIVLKPNGSGVVDVYKDMNWSNLASDKSEVPQVFVTEKELQYGSWATQLVNVLRQVNNFVDTGGANNGAVDTFVQLYAAKNTGFYYNFPWLLKNGDNLRSIENTWASIMGMGDLLSTSAKENDSFLENLGAAVVGTAASFMSPGFGFEDTKQYESTSQQSLTVTFPLYNTIDIQSAFNHFSFVNLFTFQSLKTRTSLMSFIPPKIYEVDAYSVGGIYMAAAVVTNFKVESIGTTRRMSDYSGFGSKEILIPEAYKVSITFTDLLSQSSNVFAGALGGTKISVTDFDENIDSLVTDAENAVNNFIQTGVRGAQNIFNGGNTGSGSGGP